MSTGKVNITNNRFAKLAKIGEIIFHAGDLANLWGISNANTLHTALKRYVQAGLLYRIYRGFYALKPVDKIDPLLLGIRAVHGYAYVSTETVLVKAGIIQQVADKITLVSSKSRRFKIGNNNYLVRKLADKFLFQDVGIIKEDSINMASLERAVADMLYFNPAAYFDGASLIDWKKVKKIQQAIGYPLTPKYYDFT